MPRKIIKKTLRGDIVTIYPSIEIAAREEGVADNSIRRRVFDHKALGFLWSYGDSYGKNQVKRETLCWKCAKACGGCSWSRKFQPVDGWIARRNDIACPKDGKMLYTESYIVEECPEFVEG